jgi:hypothetical protein
VLAARKSWGRQWATRHAADAASEWQRAVTESARLESLVTSYAEVRYEDLLASGQSELDRLFDFLGLPVDDGFVNETFERFSFKKLQKNQYDRDVFLNTGVATASGTSGRAEPKGFFRKGVAGDWKNSLTKNQLCEIYWVAGEALESLGYATDRGEASEKPPWSIRRRGIAGEIRKGVRKLGRKLLS